MRIAELVMAIVLSVVSIYLMWKSGENTGWDSSVPRFANITMQGEDGAPGSGFWPFYLSLAMLLCCIWIIVNWVRRVSPPSQSSEPFLDNYGVKMLILVGGGLIGFLALIELIGAYFAIMCFLFYYIRFLGRNSMLRSVAVSVAVPVVSFFFFDVLMRIVLPKGYSEPLFIPLYEIFLST